LRLGQQFGQLGLGETQILEDIFGYQTSFWVNYT
jgi:hypothetical protein